MTFKNFFHTNRIRFIFIVLFSFLQPFVLIGASYLNMWEFTALRQHDGQAWLLIIAFTTLAYLSSYAFDWGSEYLLTRQVQEFNHTLRSKIVSHVYHDRKNYQTSQVKNRLTNDLNTVNNQSFNLIPVICNFLGYILFSVIALLTMHWSLLLLILISVAVSLILPKIIEKPLQRATEKVSHQNRQYLDLIEKWLSGIAELERYLAGDKLTSVMHKGARDLEKANLKQTQEQQVLSIITNGVAQIMILILFVWTGILIKSGLVTFGAIAVIGNFSHYISLAIEYLPFYFGLIKGSKTLRNKVTAATVPVKTDEQNLATPYAFSTNNLAISFPNGETLNFPDITVNCGEKILLTGDSRTGKSTLFKLILGILSPSSGEIAFKNQEGKVIKPDLAKIGYIAQDPVLFHSTIKNNITMFNPKLDLLAEPAALAVGLGADIAKFSHGLNTEINLQKLNVSGGQRQKIILARSQIHDSKILLIDEGTSAIDQAGTRAILQELLKMPGTVIFIAHNFDKNLQLLFDREIHLSK